MRVHPLERAVAQALGRMSPLQRELTAALLTGEEEWSDERMAERHGTTCGGVRLERDHARRLLQDAVRAASAGRRER